MIFFKISIHYFLFDQPKVWFWKDHDKLVEGGGVHAEFTDDVLARNVVILLTE